VTDDCLNLEAVVGGSTAVVKNVNKRGLNAADSIAVGQITHFLGMYF